MRTATNTRSRCANTRVWKRGSALKIATQCPDKRRHHGQQTRPDQAPRRAGHPGLDHRLWHLRCAADEPRRGGHAEARRLGRAHRPHECRLPHPASAVRRHEHHLDARDRRRGELRRARRQGRLRFPPLTVLRHAVGRQPRMASPPRPRSRDRRLPAARAAEGEGLHRLSRADRGLRRRRAPPAIL